MLFLSIGSTLIIGLRPGGGGRLEKIRRRRSPRARRPPPPGRPEADAGGWTPGGQEEPVSAGSGTAKGVVTATAVVRQPTTVAVAQRPWSETTTRERWRAACGLHLFTTASAAYRSPGAGSVTARSMAGRLGWAVCCDSVRRSIRLMNSVTTKLVARPHFRPHFPFPERQACGNRRTNGKANEDETPTRSKIQGDCDATPAQISRTTAHPRQHRSEIDQCENKIAASNLFHRTEHHRIKSCTQALRLLIRVRMEARSLFQTRAIKLKLKHK